VLLSIADKWLKQFLSYRLRDSRTVIHNPNFDQIPDLLQSDFDMTALLRNELTGVQDQVDESPLYLFLIEPGLTPPLASHWNLNMVEFRVGMYGMQGAIYRFIDSSKYSA